MLTELISHYLASHKRLVVPQFGAFIVRDADRSVLFSELLRRDDGVLRRMLCERGMAELEAAGEIDRFVFEVRHAVEHGREYRMEGFGVLTAGPNATIAFRYEPEVPHTPGTSAAPKGSGTVGERVSADGAEPPRAAVRRPQAASAPGGAPSGGGSAAELPLSPLSERVVASTRAVQESFAEPKISKSAKMEPDPSVRGLRYGKPPRTTDAYTYVDRPPRRRADSFIWIAILAAALAVAAIGYGYYREVQDRRAAEEFFRAVTGETTEQTTE